MGVPLVVAQDVLLSSLRFLHLPNWGSANLQALASHPLLALGLGCVAAPICEELFFRGVLLQGLLRNYRPAGAIAQSALLFGLLHFNPAQSVAVFFMGLLIGWVYYYTRSLLLCVYLHALNNMLAFSAMQSASRQSEQNMLRHLGIAGYVVALVVAAAVLAGSIWWLRRTTPLGSAQPIA